MANICNNIMQVYFRGDKTEQSKNAKSFITQFIEDFGPIDYMYPDITNDDEFSDDFEGSFEIQFDSRWSTPTEKLEEYSNKFNCTMIGVSYEWGNGYVNSFDINNTPDTIEMEEEPQGKDLGTMADIAYDKLKDKKLNERSKQ